MPKLLAPFLFVLAAATALADSANLTIHLYATTPMRPGTTAYLNVWVDNAGPDVARNVVVTVRIDGQTPPPQRFWNCSGDRCSVGDIQPGRYGYFTVQSPLLDHDQTITYAAAAASDTPDPNLQDNSGTQSVVISSAPWVAIALGAPDWIDPGMPFSLQMPVWNADRFVASSNVVATVDLPDGVAVTSLPPGCTLSQVRLRCTIDQLGKEETAVFNFGLVAPSRTEGGTLAFNAAVELPQPNLRDIPAQKSVILSRAFVVTTAADGGDGSLRAAIAAANASCLRSDRCAIVFHIAEPSQRPWKTIRVASPLPPLDVAYLHLDGATQSNFSGIANPDGPPIEISGGGTVEGDGFAADGGCSQVISNLAINGFRRFGILVDGQVRRPDCYFGGASIVGNFIGTDPTGSVAVPNMRGIATVSPQSTTIQSNVISGNVRSAIFAFGGDLKIDANRIGVAAHADDPLPNGASGIYLAPTVGAQTHVTGNVIAFNGEMGVAVGGGERWNGLDRNRIWANGGLAIDYGLDGASPSVPSDHGTLATPVITSAVFDPATGMTTIRGTAAPVPSFYYAISIYASDAPGLGGAGEAQRFLVSALLPASFEWKVESDLRGQWVAATLSLFDYALNEANPTVQTTELSAAVQVR
jgi:hypothetical protein